MFSRTCFAIFLLGCAAPTSNDLETMKGYPTPASYCAARAEAECQATVVQKCGGKDTATCTAKGKTECIARIPQGTQYIPENAAACIDRARSAYTDGQLTAQELTSLEDTCSRVFSGPGAARAPCTVDADCSSAAGLVCLIPLTEKSGKCLAPHVVQQGGSCASEADVCAESFYCHPMKKQCVPRSGTGETCWEQQPCQPGLKCLGNLFAAHCTALAPAGTPCIENAQCASNLCNKAKSASEGTCVDVIVLSPLAAACAPFQ